MNMHMHMKKYLLAFGFIFLVQSVCILSFASGIDVFKKGIYDLSLETKLIPANSSIAEYFDIDTLTNKIPDQISASVQSGDWVSTLPGNVFVLDTSGNADNIIEYWEINFANVKKGRVVFSRIIINNSSSDKNSYAWNLKIKCKFIRYR